MFPWLPGVQILDALGLLCTQILPSKEFLDTPFGPQSLCCSPRFASKETVSSARPEEKHSLRFSSGIWPAVSSSFLLYWQKRGRAERSAQREGFNKLL